MFKSLLAYTSGLLSSLLKPRGVDDILKSYQKTVDDLNAVAADKMEEAVKLDAKADALYQKADAAEAESLRAERLSEQFSKVLFGESVSDAFTPEEEAELMYPYTNS